MEEYGGGREVGEGPRGGPPRSVVREKGARWQGLTILATSHLGQPQIGEITVANADTLTAVVGRLSFA